MGVCDIYGFGFGLKLEAGEGCVSDRHHKGGTEVCCKDNASNSIFGIFGRSKSKLFVIFRVV